MRLTNLTCSNGFAVNIGFDYSFQVSIDEEDFTGRTFHFVVKESKRNSSSPATLVQLTNSTDNSVSGVFLSVVTHGIVDILIKASDSASIDPQQAVYEFYYEIASAKVLLFEGTLEFFDGVV